MVDPENQHQQQQQQHNHRHHGGVYNYGMDVYERNTGIWNQSNHVEERRNHRSAAINNTPGYRNGNRVHHLRVIQMYNPADWNHLFGGETLDPALREYAQATIEYAQDETHTLPFAGQMEVSLLMQEHYRPGVHVATFFVHLTPHRHFYDGHMIQMEFLDGRNTHLTINRLFDTDTNAVVLQATEYQLLEFLSDDDEAMDLLHGSFLDDEFNPDRFSYVDDEPNGRGSYRVDPNANDEHDWHDCAEGVAVARAIPVPPPVNDFTAIYQRNYNIYRAHAAAGEDNDDYDDDDIIIRNNIIPNIYNVVEENFPAQG